MRKWHRHLSFIFGAFLLFIAVTGVASHVAAMVAQGGVFEQEKPKERQPEQAQASGDRSSIDPSEVVRDPKKANAARKWVGFFHHLHSGETFGPIGIIISLLSGFAMIFFSFSGLWMYFQMFVRRRKLGKPELFWD